MPITINADFTRFNYMAKKLISNAIFRTKNVSKNLKNEVIEEIWSKTKNLNIDQALMQAR